MILNRVRAALGEDRVVKLAICGCGVAIANLKSRDPQIMVMAALALGAIGRTDAQPLLAPLLANPDQSVRLAAATAILELKGS